MTTSNIEGFRLSPQQRYLWLQQKNDIDYAAQSAFLITGNLNIQLLQQAVQKVFARHEIFRTNFHSLPGIKIPVQVIQSSNFPIWRNIDFSKYDSDEQSKKIENYLFADRRLLNKDDNNSLLSLSLVNLSDNKYLLVLTLSSLCADAWTLNNLFSEISETYNFCFKNQKLLDAPIQYIQFSEWQNQLLEDEDAEAGQEYWQQHNFINQPPLILPWESNLSREIQFVSAIFNQKISSDLVDKISTIVTQQNTTISNFLLTCWQTLIWRLTNQDNIIISNIFNDRKYEELQGLMGLASKCLPVQCVFQKDFKFSEVLTQISDNIHQINKWQEYFIWQDNTEGVANCQELPIGFEFQELPKDCSSGDVTFSLFHHFSCFAPFKLKLNCRQTISEIILELQYNQCLFSHDNIQQIFECFLNIVTSVIDNFNANIAELEIINNQEKNQLLVTFNNTYKKYPAFQCIHQLFEQQVKKTPEYTAVVCENQKLTYTQLNARANQVAHYLKNLGISADVLVGLYLERTVDIIVGILGVLKASAAYLPLDPKLPAENLAFRVQDAQATIVLTQQSLAEKLLPTEAQIICLDTDWETIALESCENPQTSVQPENLVYAIFTSGSTGKPKAVAIEHQQLLNYLYGILDRLNLPTAASFATVSTFAADLGNTVVFASLCTGGCLHILSQERASDAQAIADYFQQYPIDCLKIVPSHLTALLTASPTRSILPRQCLILGGEASTWDLIKNIRQQAPKCQIFNHYGPTEATVGVLTYPIEISHSDAKTVPLGKPLPNTQVFVLDEKLQLVPRGVVGELYIGGDCLARGYLHHPELTQEKFIQNPFVNFQLARGKFSHRIYKTGDLVRYLPDGNLEFVGRADNQIKIRGFRIELGEIEATLKENYQVQTAVVIVEDNQRLVAYIVLKSESHRSPRQQSEIINDLRSFCFQKLPDYMLPSAFVLLQALPLTSNGKVNIQALIALAKNRSEVNQIYIEARTPIEKTLSEIWLQLLRLEQVGIHDNFFDLGGHSLLITQLLAKVRKAFHIEINLRDLFDAPTIADLSQIIERKNVGIFTDTANVNLLEEAVLSPSIQVNVSGEYQSHPQSILLTGATGFIGSFLLYELLQQTTATIYCLVRSQDNISTQARLINSLKSYLLWDESFRQRIMTVNGDLAKQFLGLSEDKFLSLARQIDVIYHNGAWVNFTYPYSVLKAANVLGTQEILHLATQMKIKPVHFISTIGVAQIEDNPDKIEKSDNGYTQSKWVAEKLIKIAGERGVPISIYRPGRICGDSKTGACNPEDHTFRLIRGCIQLGSAPKQNFMVNLTPVDYASKAIVYLSQQKSSLGQIFDITNPQSISWCEMANLICTLGYPIQQIPYEHWRDKLLQSSEAENNNALYPLIGMFSETYEKSSNQNSVKDNFHYHNTLAGLAESGLTCPPVNYELLQTYFKYLISTGFLSQPQLSKQF
ncbi:amino acid adenylation domain-containing protein [Calothrix sp. NIES-4101]|nr:amino acid adenylation domain-containing protein [Calothrix sp. NIES-4101]